MFNGEIQAGRYYVGGSGGQHETFIRYIEWLNEPRGQLGWRDYGLCDGKSIGNGECSTRAFSIWAIRPATEAEIARCHEDPNQINRMHERVRVIAEAALRDPSILSDQELEAELGRRRKARRQTHARSTSTDEKRVNEIAELLNKKRDENPKRIDMADAAEKPWPLRWDAEVVKAIARAATQMDLEDVIENFSLTDSEELAVILDAFSSDEVIAEADRFERAVETAGEAFVSGVNSVSGTLGFQHWRLYDWSYGIEALEIRPAVVDLSRATGKQGDEAWSCMSHFEFKHVIDNLAKVLDEVEDFGYMNNDEGEYLYADGLIEGSAITIRLFTEPAEDAEAAEPE